MHKVIYLVNVIILIAYQYTIIKIIMNWNGMRNITLHIAAQYKYTVNHKVMEKQLKFKKI